MLLAYACANCDSGSNADDGTHTNRGAHSDSDFDANAESSAFSHSNTDRRAHPHANADCCAHPHANADRCAHPHANADRCAGNAIPAEAQALLYENAATVRDELVRNVEHCRFAYAYAGLPAKHDNEEGWVVEGRMVMRDGRLQYSGGSTSRTPKGDDAARIPESDYGVDIFDVDYDPVEWFGAEYQSRLDDAPRGNYAGRSTYLGQPGLRYKTSVEREGAHGAEMPVSTLTIIDYLIENPYVFVESEYSIFANGIRQLERQFMRYQFELTHCIAGEKHDSAAVAVWQELAEKGADVYTPIRDGLLEGCHLTLRENSVQWADFRGDSFPGGPLESKGRYAIARDMEGFWRVTSEGEVQQKGSIVYRIRMTPDGTWVLDTQTGEWKEISADGTGVYEDFSEFLIDHFAVGYPRFVDLEGFPVSSDHGQYYDYRYVGKTEVDGRAAARYEQVSAHSQVIRCGRGLEDADRSI